MEIRGLEFGVAEYGAAVIGGDEIEIAEYGAVGISSAAIGGQDDGRAEVGDKKDN